jgi:hypothetical protein
MIGQALAVQMFAELLFMETQRRHARGAKSTA